MDKFVKRLTKCDGDEKRQETSKVLDRRKRQKFYDCSKRTRQYDEAWGKSNPWLATETTDDGEVMFCKWCRTHMACSSKSTRCAFIKGTNNWKASTVHDHNESDIHKRAETVEKAKRRPVAESKAQKLLSSLNNETAERLLLLFRAAHALAKHNRSFKDFSWQVDLMQSSGLDVGKRYRNEKAAAEFVASIAESTRQTCVKAPAVKGKFVAVLCDGATDSSIEEQEIVYLRTCSEGKVSTTFLGCQGVSKANAENILAAIEEAITQYSGLGLDQFYKKLVALGSGGAAVMLGRKSGIAARLKDKNPALQAVHCYAHRLELAYKNALKSIPLFEKLDTLLLNIYLYYRTPLNRSNLKTTYQAFSKQVQVPSRVGGTRWVSHNLNALGTLLRNYDVFTVHLSQAAMGNTGEGPAKAKGILHLLLQPNTVMFAHLMWDILLVLSRLSTKLQEQTASASQVHHNYSVAVEMLDKFKTSPGDKVSGVLNLKVGDIFKGQTLTASRGKTEDFSAVRGKTLSALLQCLSCRFEDATSDVIQASRIVDLHTWPMDNITDFGDQQVRLLVAHFQVILLNAEVDVDQIGVEWCSLKSSVVNHGPSQLSWEVINQAYARDHTNILSLVDLVLTLPASSAECERGFSLMKQVKTDWRSSLKSSTLSDLMTVQLYSPSVLEYNPEPAVEHWFMASQRQRRPHEWQYDVESETNDVDEDEMDSDLLQLAEQRLLEMAKTADLD